MSVDLAPGLSRKLKKVLECRTDSPDMSASLATLDSFYTSNTAHDRRHLRSTIEKRSLSINHEFLLAAAPALEALDRVEEDVNGLAECCDKIAKALSNCNVATGDIINTTERLEQELETTTQRQEIVSCFLRDYQLSNEEIIALREENLNANFFKALSRVQEIHTNCKILLRTHHQITKAYSLQRAGLELMDMMAVYQEGAYERLCRWVQAECRKLGDSDNTEVSELLKKAVSCLKERPVLFKYCAEEVANMRHNALFRRFISALTRGGPGGLPRPIEVHAHDPLRYVGDMLAWLHQALASERELVLVLFDQDTALDTGPTARRFSKDGAISSTKSEDLTFVLDRIFEGVCRPFKVRVEQVLQSQPSLILLYKLSNSLEFYNYTIEDLLGKDTALTNTLTVLKDAAQHTFFNILKARGDKILKYPPQITADLSPPSVVSEGVLVLLEIIDTYNSMMVSASGKKPDFEPVISALLDPIVQMCEQVADAQKSKGTNLSSRRNRLGTDSRRLSVAPSSSSVDAILNNGTSSASLQHPETPLKIFLINCLSAIQQPLLRHEAAEKYAQRLASMIENQLKILVDNEAATILNACGLASKVSYIRSWVNEQDGDISSPLSAREETSQQAILDCTKAFFSIVAGSEGSLPEFEQIQLPQLRSQACLQVARELAEVYELVYGAVVDPVNQYPEPKSLLRHPPDQVRTILGI